MGTVLVTGTNTPLGLRVCAELHASGRALRCLVDPEDRVPALAGIPHQRVEGTVADDEVLARALRGCDAVVHLASAGLGTAFGAERTWRINALCTQRLARAARVAGVARFLHCSSLVTIGASRRPIVLDEGSTYDLQHARLPYVHSRRQGEQAVLAEAERGLPAVVVNPGVLLGPDSTVTQMAANVRMAMAPPGGVNVVDVRDAAHGCVLALTYGRPGQRYILGGENVTARDLVASMLHASRREPPRLTLPPVLARGLALLVRASEIITPLRPPITSQMLRMFPLYFWVSSAKAERELGYLPTRDLAAMVEHREQQVGTPGRIRVETPV